MVRVGLSYNAVKGGSSAGSIRNCFTEVGAKVDSLDYRAIMEEIPKEDFDRLYTTGSGRQQLFAHAKAKAMTLLDDIDCLVIPGNDAMIDPVLFNQARIEGENYDFSRSIAELALAQVALQRGMPILGVCGGHQVLAVLHGGTIKDLSKEQLISQGVMDYDTVHISTDSILYRILTGTRSIPDAHTKALSGEFFGAHNQVIDTLGKSFKGTALSNDKDCIEATEIEFGAPVLTTQFHPEVAANGFPEAGALYMRTEHEAEINFRVFKFFKKAAETYRHKKTVMAQLQKAHQQLGHGFTPKTTAQLYGALPVSAKKEDTPKQSLSNWDKVGIAVNCAASLLLIAYLLISFANPLIASVLMVSASITLVGMTTNMLLDNFANINPIKSTVAFLFAPIAKAYRAIVGAILVKNTINKMDARANHVRTSLNDQLPPTHPDESYDKLSALRKQAPKESVDAPGDILKNTHAKLFQPIENTAASDKPSYSPSLGQ